MQIACKQETLRYVGSLHCGLPNSGKPLSIAAENTVKLKVCCVSEAARAARRLQACTVAEVIVCLRPSLTRATANYIAHTCTQHREAQQHHN